MNVSHMRDSSPHLPSPSAVEDHPDLRPAPEPDVPPNLVSFEEWRKLQEEEIEHRDTAETESVTISEQISADTSAAAVSVTEPTGPISPAGKAAQRPSEETGSINSGSSAASSLASSSSSSSSDLPSKSPVLPSHNKYNYASPDCSARIHSASPQTQHAASLLHKSRDRYMLTPCKADEHWVVVELCDEIRIEALEVAVWEFFSGVVREIRVSVGGEDAEDGDINEDGEIRVRSSEWKEVGSFVGKNVRGAQTFTLTQPTSFHRFVRLDFPSYYGTEYYCPVSQLKVYGMNQMEAFKWEEKRQAAVAREKDKDRNANKDRDTEERKAKEKVQAEKIRAQQREEDKRKELELDELERLLSEQARRNQPVELITDSVTAEIVSVGSSISNPSIASPTNPGAGTLSTPLEEPSTTVVDNVPSSLNTHNATSTISRSPLSDISVDGSQPTVTSYNSTTSTSVSSSTYTRASPPRSDSSESIYAFIIRRLNALEGNSTLVARYIEEQTKIMRHMLGRVERSWEEWRTDWEHEDRGRWERERMRQEDRLGRVISQMEQQRVSLERERRDIMTQLRVLGDEIGYERRRGIAQLFILFVMVALGVATRSSSIDAILKPLIAEAKRRRSFYVKRAVTGPLTGLHIDLGSGRPPAIIGLKRPTPIPSPSSRQMQIHPRPPSSNPDSRSITNGPSSSPVSRLRMNGRTPSLKRPTTPGLRQRRPNLPPPFRSFSAANPGEPASAAPSHSSGSAALLSPGLDQRPRQSLPPLPGGQRKLAKSAHLHTIEADRVRDRGHQEGRVVLKSGLSGVVIRQGEESGQKSPKALPSEHQVSDGPFAETPMTRNRMSRMRDEVDNAVHDGELDGHSEWDTEDTDVSAYSASEVDDEVNITAEDQTIQIDKSEVFKDDLEGDADNDTVEKELAEELLDIWKSKSM
ncbi:hypothetical protein M231_03381 [Tremella mesenterica]|uniref:SUN domain-containing protein n=1 Tax=Tremella mesenterica TaxID=5217 RepID=A0A4Q1BNJ8_TREME|nr:hypothetical protein M231_03381 [Tremella mesenterica]